MSDNTKSALLALDWGTSALRAWRVAADGRVLERRDRPWGILNLPAGGYPAAYAAITEGWRDSDVPAIACGMVGSRQGWKQVDYLTVPVQTGQIGRGLATVECPGGVLHLVPGLLDASRPDVMRGEETEAIGALEQLGHPRGDVLLVMPGTHCKWLQVRDAVLSGFATFMTGELFALLTRHSILGQGTAVPEGAVPPAPEARDEGFAQGVRAAAADGLAAHLFSARALMLTGRLLPALVPDYLSGLLIGDELTQALGRSSRPDQVVLVGEPALTRRYRLGFTTLGHDAPVALDATSVRGLYRIAVAAGLVTAQAGES